MSWPLKPLSELCLLGVDCVNKTAPVVDYPTPYKMIRTTNVKLGFIDVDTVRYVTEETFQSWTRRSQPRFGDVILTREAPVGEVGRCTFDDNQNIFLGQRLFQYRPDPELLDWNYLAYVLQSPMVQSKLHGMSFGATVAHIKVGDAENLEIPCPSLDVQKSIGCLLATYDDLIEANSRRIFLLEESARLLYREWFINLRFPGYELASWQDGIPDGWDRKPVSELIEINPKTPFERDRSYPFLPMQALSESSMIINEPEERVIAGGAKFQNLDTLLARITPCLENGKTGFVQFLSEDSPVGSGSTEFIVMRSKSVSPFWVYCLARDDGFREHAIRSMVGSDGRQRVNSKCFDTYMTWQPPLSVLNAFDQLMQPVFAQVELMNRQNKVLKKTRDELLPRLMSGAIQV